MTPQSPMERPSQSHWILHSNRLSEGSFHAPSMAHWSTFLFQLIQMPGSIPIYGAPLCCSILSSRCVPPPCSMCLYGSHTCLNMDLQGARDHCIIVYVVYYCFKIRYVCYGCAPPIHLSWNMHLVFHIPHLEYVLGIPCSISGTHTRCSTFGTYTSCSTFGTYTRCSTFGTHTRCSIGYYFHKVMHCSSSPVQIAN